VNVLHALARPEILALKPYAHAVWVPHLKRLHANEAPWRPYGDATEMGLNRYPESQPHALIGRLADLYGVPAACVLATRGADEAIDVLSRIFLRPGTDAILQLSPSFGMYQLCARLQGAGVVELPLRAEQNWALDPDQLLALWRPHIKLVYLCSPNNPTANSFELAALERICTALDGKAVVVLDEAYVEWSRFASLTRWLSRFQTLAILRTLSKAHALAGARLGALLGSPELIALGQKVIPPYALPQPTIEAGLRALQPEQLAASQQRVEVLLVEREHFAQCLAASPLVDKVWPSDTNFLLIDCHDAERFLHNCMASGYIVRDMRGYPALPRSLRISVGLREDTEALMHCVGQK
jgi:histidinol-phosphate aminotransferase